MDEWVKNAMVYRHTRKNKEKINVAVAKEKKHKTQISVTKTCTSGQAVLDKVTFSKTYFTTCRDIPLTLARDFGKSFRTAHG